jgi:hypothetical protein
LLIPCRMTGYKSLAGSLGQILQRDRAAEYSVTEAHRALMENICKIRHSVKLLPRYDQR